jgi:large repetitive protein
VGNTSSPTTVSLIKNTAGPKLVSSTPAINTTVASPGSVTLSFDRVLAPGSLLTLTSGAVSVSGTSVISNQSLVFTPTTPLTSATYTAAAVAVDSFANATAVQVTFTVDATPPGPPTVTPPSSIDFNNAPSAPFSGTAEPGSTISLTVANGGSSVETGALTDGSGNWTTNVDVHTLADGTLSASVTATDAVGNVSTPTTTTVTKQTVAGAPAISGVLATANQLTINLVAPTNTGGLPITGYEATLMTGSTVLTFTSTTTAVVATGLPQGTAYTVTAATQTAAGFGPSSLPTPAATKFATKITIVPATRTVPHGGTLTISGVISRSTAGTPIKGAKAILWQLDSTNHKTEAGRMTATNVSGQWSITITPTTGTFRYFATWAGDASDVFCQSPNSLAITVS